MGGDDIRRWAISVPERSSSSGNTQHWPRNPGVYEIGASPSCWPLGLQPTVSGGAEYPKGGGR